MLNPTILMHQIKLATPVGCVRGGRAMIFRLVARVGIVRPVTHHQVKQLLGDAPYPELNAIAFSGSFASSRSVTYGQSRLAAPCQHRNGRSRFQLQQPIPRCLYEIVDRLINTLKQGLLIIITTVLTKRVYYNMDIRIKLTDFLFTVAFPIYDYR